VAIAPSRAPGFERAEAWDPEAWGPLHGPGGPEEHWSTDNAAVVARELGVPCVVNTRTGTQQLRTGDRVRVDGGAGTVEILDSAD
jgi:phosphoenolpyruvate-protein kinase (PTS system EI component)